MKLHVSCFLAVLTAIVLLIAKPAFSCLTTPSTLKFVQVIYHLGDRNPNQPFGPSDPNPESSWSGGWAALSQLGKLQLYRLGEQTRQRYQSFLGKALRYEEVYVHSSELPRTHTSSRCFLAGLFSAASSEEEKEKCDEIENLSTNSIRTMLAADDWIMRGPKTCPRTTAHLLNSYYYSSPSISSFIKENCEIIDYVTKAAGVHVNDDVINMKRAWMIGNNINIASISGKKVPDWVTPEIMDRLRQLRVIKFDTFTSASPEIVRIAGGTLLGHVLDNFIKSRRSEPPVENGLEVKDLKLMAFCGHEVNVVSFLAALNLFSLPFGPDYAAAVFMELHRLRDFYFVKIFHQDGIDARATELQIPGCEPPCPLDQLLRTLNSTAVWSNSELMSICDHDYFWEFPPKIVMLFVFMLSSCIQQREGNELVGVITDAFRRFPRL